MKTKWTLAIFILAALALLAWKVGVTNAYFVDTETSSNNQYTAWVSKLWTQTTQTDFDSGVLSNTETSSSPGDVKLSIVPNLTLINSDSAEVSTATSSSSAWQLVKTLNFSKSDSSCTQLRIDSNLKVANSANTVTSSIRLNGSEILTHSTNSTSYVTYNDTFDFSGYAVGNYTLTLYMSVNGGTAYNSLFDVYQTNPSVVGSNDTEVYATGIANLFPAYGSPVKTLTFTKSGTAYNNLLFNTNLYATGNTAYLRIDIDGTTVFTHSTTSSTYVSYSDILDFSGYADGSHTVNLYLSIGNKKQYAYNSQFDIWATSPVLLASDDNEYSISGTLDWQLVKWISFNTAGPSYDELQINTDLHASGSATAYSSIRIDDVEVATHSTTNTSYVGYSDVIDTSGLSDGSHTLKLYLESSNKLKPAYNSTFAIYRTHTYAASGTIASQVLDTAVANSRWDALCWNESLPSGTGTTFEVRASDTAFLASDASPSWTAVGGTSPVTTVSVRGRYKQWRATLTADSTQASTPDLQEVRVYYYGN